jgi:hypothetical protein
MARPVTRELPAARARAVEIRRLLAAGLSKHAIARRLGVSVMTVYRAIAPNAGTSERSNVPTLNRRGAGDGYPEALLRQVPRDFVAILPPGHYRALVAAAARSSSPAASESLRQALLLHAEPMIPPPTSVELALSEEEEGEMRKAPDFT